MTNFWDINLMMGSAVSTKRSCFQGSSDVGCRIVDEKIRFDMTPGDGATLATWKFQSLLVSYLGLKRQSCGEPPCCLSWISQKPKKDQIRDLGVMMMMQKIIPQKNMLASLGSNDCCFPNAFFWFKKNGNLQVQGPAWIACKRPGGATGVCGRPRFDLRKLQQLAVWSSFCGRYIKPCK